MICNLGIIERTIRILVGLGLLGYTMHLLMHFAGPANITDITSFVFWWIWGFTAIDAVALIKGAVGFCAAWKLLGINTRSRKTQTES